MGSSHNGGRMLGLYVHGSGPRKALAALQPAQTLETLVKE